MGSRPYHWLIPYNFHMRCCDFDVAYKHRNFVNDQKCLLNQPIDNDDPITFKIDCVLQ